MFFLISSWRSFLRNLQIFENYEATSGTFEGRSRRSQSDQRRFPKNVRQYIFQTNARRTDTKMKHFENFDFKGYLSHSIFWKCLMRFSGTSPWSQISYEGTIFDAEHDRIFENFGESRNQFKNHKCFILISVTDGARWDSNLISSRFLIWKL